MHPGLRRGERSGGTTKLGLFAYALALVVIVLDQLSKLAILGRVFPGACPRFVADPAAFDSACSVQLLPVLSLSMVWNRGVSFGLFQSGDTGRWILVGFSLLVAAALAWWVRRAERPIMALALGLVIGGAIGNLIDRVRFGAVADFIDVSGLGFFPWVFNVADSAITVGVILLVLDSFLPQRRTPRAA